MTSPGPLPKPDELRQRRNEPQGPVTRITQEAIAGLPFPIDLSPRAPEPKDDWNPIVGELWGALQRDPAALSMGPAAWAFAKVMCEAIDVDLMEHVVAVLQPTEANPAGEVIRERTPIKGATLTALLKWASANGFHLADRLKMYIDVEFHKNAGTNGTAAPVTDITSSRREALRPVASE